MSTPVHFSDYGKKCKDLLEKKFKKAKKSEFGVKSKSSDGNVEVQTSLVGMAKSKGSSRPFRVCIFFPTKLNFYLFIKGGTGLFPPAEIAPGTLLHSFTFCCTHFT